MSSETDDPVLELVETLAEFEFDPLGFVEWAFPWGEAGTTLATKAGPEEWQRQELVAIGEKLRAGGDLGAVIKEARSAGHGVGKSAFVAWLILWAASTRENTRGVVTANTETQLRTKTWAELSKWHQLFIGRDLFVCTATSIFSADPKSAKTWRIDAITWTKERSEAFAGLHNEGNRILVIFDEAATIDDVIWEVTEGALTDARTQIIWCVFGNPTRTTGRFHKACTRHSGGWSHRSVDSRTVSITNKTQIEAWARDYGDDSDFFRVRVKGQFPRQGFANFIGAELVENARLRRVPKVSWMQHQKILAIDPARFGEDFTVITLRQGLIAHWQLKMSGFDGPDVAGRVIEIVREEQASGQQISCIAYDAVGNGADLDSSLRRASGLPFLIPVQWGVPAKDDMQYFNQRSEAWGTMKGWLANGQIPDDDDLADELSSLEYGYDARLRIQLESKDDAKRRGIASPDCADSLAISFIPELIDRRIVTAKVRPVQPRKVIWSRTAGVR